MLPSEREVRKGVSLVKAKELLLASSAFSAACCDVTQRDTGEREREREKAVNKEGLSPLSPSLSLSFSLSLSLLSLSPAPSKFPFFKGGAPCKPALARNVYYCGCGCCLLRKAWILITGILMTEFGIFLQSVWQNGPKICSLSKIVVFGGIEVFLRLQNLFLPILQCSTIFVADCNFASNSFFKKPSILQKSLNLKPVEFRAEFKIRPIFLQSVPNSGKARTSLNPSQKIRDSSFPANFPPLNFR